MADVEIGGLTKVLDRMKDVSAQMKGKITRSATRKGANVIRDAVRQGWQRVDRTDTPNSIADNVAVQFAGRTFRRTGDIMFRVGIRGGAKQDSDTKENRRGRRVGKAYKTGGSTFYWRFYELGTSRQPARPVMQPALASSAEGAFAAMAKEFDRQFAKLGKEPG